jgi:hypothetical protein
MSSARARRALAYVNPDVELLDVVSFRSAVIKVVQA